MGMGMGMGMADQTAVVYGDFASKGDALTGFRD
jgi:hypothetical protein